MSTSTVPFISHNHNNDITCIFTTSNKSAQNSCDDHSEDFSGTKEEGSVQGSHIAIKETSMEDFQTIFEPKNNESSPEDLEKGKTRLEEHTQNTSQDKPLLKDELFFNRGQSKNSSSPHSLSSSHHHHHNHNRYNQPPIPTQHPRTIEGQTEDRLVEFVGDEFLNKNPHTRRTILWNPQRNSTHDPVVLYRFYQFVCPCTGKVWFSPLHRAKDGCFCRDCHRFIKPFGHIDGLTPYMGHELCYAKFECHVCNRSWSCQKSKSNFPDNCYNCGTIVYPYYQVAHSVLQRKIRKQNGRALRFENSYNTSSTVSNSTDSDSDLEVDDQLHIQCQSTQRNPFPQPLRVLAQGLSKNQPDHEIRVVKGIRKNGSKMIMHSSVGIVSEVRNKSGFKKSPKIGVSTSEPSLSSWSNKENRIESMRRQNEMTQKQR